MVFIYNNTKIRDIKVSNSKSERLPTPQQILRAQTKKFDEYGQSIGYANSDFLKIEFYNMLLLTKVNDIVLESDKQQEICGISNQPSTKNILSGRSKKIFTTHLLKLRRVLFDYFRACKILSIEKGFYYNIDSTPDNIFELESKSLSRLVNNPKQHNLKELKYLLRSYRKTDDLFAYSNWHFSQARRYLELLTYKLWQTQSRVIASRPACIELAGTDESQVLGFELHDDLLVHCYQLKKVFYDLLQVLQLTTKRKLHYRPKCTPTIGQLTYYENLKIFDDEYNIIRAANIISDSQHRKKSEITKANRRLDHACNRKNPRSNPRN